MKVILYGLLIYFLYKLIFDFIIPVSKTTKEVRQKIKNMQEQNQQSPSTTPTQKTTDPGGDYIEFEEVK